MLPATPAVPVHPVPAVTAEIQEVLEIREAHPAVLLRAAVRVPAGTKIPEVLPAAVPAEIKNRAAVLQAVLLGHQVLVPQAANHPQRSQVPLL